MDFVRKTPILHIFMKLPLIYQSHITAITSSRKYEAQSNVTTIIAYINVKSPR